MAKGKKTGGRVKGVPNKLTTGAKEVIAQVASNIGGVARMTKWVREGWGLPLSLPHIGWTEVGPGQRSLHWPGFSFDSRSAFGLNNRAPLVVLQSPNLAPARLSTGWGFLFKRP